MSLPGAQPGATPGSSSTPGRGCAGGEDEDGTHFTQAPCGELSAGGQSVHMDMARRACCLT